MIKHTWKTIIIITLIVFIIAFFLINTALANHNKIKYKVRFESQDNQEINLTNNEHGIQGTITDEKTEKDQEEKNKNEPNWRIRIPEIGLDAQIHEGTTKEVMDEYVGHFEETKIEYGNVGLAAHNRGYPVNFFQNLKELKKGSEIIYSHGNFEMTYIVETIEIIENTNWEYLENTEENYITLITCVENEPKYRRCIQGIEKVESEEF